MSKPPKIPGMSDGGIILGQPQPPRLTEHRTQFHSCQVGLAVMLNEENVCQGFRVTIMDPGDRRLYILDIMDDIMDDWKNAIPNFPRVGEKIDPEDGTVVS